MGPGSRSFSTNPDLVFSTGQSNSSLLRIWSVLGESKLLSSFNAKFMSLVHVSELLLHFFPFPLVKPYLIIKPTQNVAQEKVAHNPCMHCNTTVLTFHTGISFPKFQEKGRRREEKQTETEIVGNYTRERCIQMETKITHAWKWDSPLVSGHMAALHELQITMIRKHMTIPTILGWRIMGGGKEKEDDSCIITCSNDSHIQQDIQEIHTHKSEWKIARPSGQIAF